MFPKALLTYGYQTQTLNDLEPAHEMEYQPFLFDECYSETKLQFFVDQQSRALIIPTIISNNIPLRRI